MSEESFDGGGELVEDVTKTYGREGRKLEVKRGCTVGRAVNGCIIFNYIWIMLTALIVSGTLGVLNDKLAKGYPDSSTDNHTCILYSTCATKDGDKCAMHYNNSGGCQFIVGGFAIIALGALVYIIMSIIRIIFSTDIWVTVAVDVVVNLALVLFVLVMGLTLSIGLAFTCGEVNKFYGSSGLRNCSAKAIPNSKGYKFYREVNISQSAAWFCFMCTVFGLVIFLVRSCIYCRRRTVVPSMPRGSDILTAEDNYRDDNREFHHGDDVKLPTVI